MIVEAIKSLTEGKDLDQDTVVAVMDEIMNGEATDAQKAAYLIAMKMKGETIEEITASAIGMRKHCLRVDYNQDVLEIVGTGGDGAHSINISTIASLIVAAAGTKVAKHGNRAASSKCGAADVLEALGVKLDLEPEKAKKCLDEANFTFMFAQKYHGAMRYVGGVRREMKVATIFNILGPLANPAFANMQLLGVYEEKKVEPLARVLYNLGVKKGMAVYGQDGLDEISLSAPTTVCEINDGKFDTYVITPEQFGLTRCQKSDIVGGTPEENAAIARDILSGKLTGPKADIVLLNAGAALHITQGISIQEGIELARQTVASGKALAALEKVIALTNE
jgi:anthranilate phosphoribosyltransferase